ncbi:tetratricopeptide repeat protein, partial [Thermodesulfobacteriota bacterium]
MADTGSSWRTFLKYFMAQCLKELGQYKEAITVLKKAEKYDNERTDIYNLMGFCHFKLREHDEAI